jgi:hypothetical protein
MSRSLLRAWLLADIEPLSHLFEWWSDLEVNPDPEFESHMDFRDLTAQQEFAFGRRLAEQCFVGDRRCLSPRPLTVTPPTLP